ncbi:MAG: hypothetical protein RBS57_16135, partial [Desulforhabdus sp.]|nr:hypothetical protein [Desulforhabdus sp.]
MKASLHYQDELPTYDASIDSRPWSSGSKEILTFLQHSRESFYLRGAQPTPLSYLLAGGLSSIHKSIVLITPTEREAEKYIENLSFFLGRDEQRSNSSLNNRIWHFPSRTGHKAQWLGKMEANARRLEALYALRTAASPILIVASVVGLLELLPPPKVFLNQAQYLLPGEEINLEVMGQKLVELGYSHVSLVEEYGDFSRRGSILDIYAPLYKWPLRLEFFGDELESIRLFHPSTQRSMGTLEDLVLLPGSEIILDAAAKDRAREAVYEDVKSEKLTPTAGNVWLERIEEGYQTDSFEGLLPVFYERTATLFDYLDPSMVFVWSDTGEIRKELNEFYGRLDQDAEKPSSPHEWNRPQASLYQQLDQFDRAVEDFQQICVGGFSSSTGKDFEIRAKSHDELALAISSHPTKDRLLEPLARQFQKWQQEGVSSFLVCARKEQAKRLTELLNGYNIDV